MTRQCWTCGADFEDGVTKKACSKRVLDESRDDVPTLCHDCNAKACGVRPFRIGNLSFPALPPDVRTSVHEIRGGELVPK